MSEFILHLSPYKLGDIPDRQTILSAAEQVLEATVSWEEGKTFHSIVKTFHGVTPSGDTWHCRVSRHPGLPFDTFWRFLGENKPENEQQFIPEIKYFAEVPIEQLHATSQTISGPSQRLVTLFYHFPPPTSDRVFTVLQTSELSEGPTRKGIIVSLPIDLANTQFKFFELDHGKPRTKGRYVSVERLLELEDGSVEWRMATASTPGGLIPHFIVERTVPGSIAGDVPHFLQWLNSATNSG